MKDLVHDDLEDIDENLIKDIDILMIGDEIDYQDNDILQEDFENYYQDSDIVI